MQGNFLSLALCIFASKAVLAEYDELHQEHSKSGVDRRPFYIIANMANTIEQAEYFLSMGANALQVDFEFGEGYYTQFMLYHGPPCDCCTECEKKENYHTYFLRMKNLTNPSNPQFNPNLAMIKINLKLTDWNRIQQTTSLTTGLYYNYLNQNKTKMDLKVVFSAPPPYHGAYLAEIERNIGQKGLPIYYDLLGYHTYYPRIGDLKREMLEDHKFRGRMFQGIGDSNCMKTINDPDTKFNDLLDLRRDLGYEDFGYVYYYTRDSRQSIRALLNKQVNGIVTNKPQLVREIINEEFKDKFYIVKRTT